MSRRRRAVATLFGAPLYYTNTAVSITPTYGDTLVTNGTFDSDASGWTGSNATLASAAGGQAGNCLQVTLTGALGYGYQNVTVEAGSWYAVDQYQKDGTRASIFLVGTAPGGSEYYAINPGNLAVWTQYFGTLRATGTQLSISGQVNSTGVGNTGLFDTIRARKLSNTARLFSHSQAYGDYTVNLKRAARYAGGVYGLYSDANNWVLLYIRVNTAGASQALLVQNVAGTQTVLGTYAITYVADKDLTLRVHKNGTMDAIYNTATLASGVAASGLSGKQGGPFATDAAQVTINSYTWDARSAT